MKSSPKDSRKMTLTQAAGYLGISTRKMAQMVRDGEIKNVTVDPLDKRRRLVEVRQLDALRQRSMSKR
jgi:excisionase family DNA binding protein